jgi:hypothetical protein
VPEHQKQKVDQTSIGKQGSPTCRIMGIKEVITDYMHSKLNDE